MAQNLSSVIRERLADYDGKDVIAGRAKLIEFWRAAHPEAAKEASVALHPLMLMSKRDPSAMRDLPDEEWHNDVYVVTLRRRPDHVFNTREPMVQLGISSLEERRVWDASEALAPQRALPR